MLWLGPPELPTGVCSSQHVTTAQLVAGWCLAGNLSSWSLLVSAASACIATALEQICSRCMHCCALVVRAGILAGLGVVLPGRQPAVEQIWGMPAAGASTGGRRARMYCRGARMCMPPECPAGLVNASGSVSA
jgi:hypothetical protein